MVKLSLVGQWCNCVESPAYCVDNVDAINILFIFYCEWHERVCVLDTFILNLVNERQYTLSSNPYCNIQLQFLLFSKSLISLIKQHSTSLHTDFDFSHWPNKHIYSHWERLTG